MSRIRSIHPGIISDEAFMTLTVEAPLAIAVLLGLWMEADDDGIFEWKPLTIKVKSIPAAPVEITELLNTLMRLNFIRQYEAEGKQYGAIRNFKAWQRPKQPKVKWPKTAEIEAYVGSTSPSLPHDFPTDGEMSPQREEVGGRMEEKQKPTVSSKKAVRWEIGQKVPADWLERTRAKFPKVEAFRFQSQTRQFEDYWPGQEGKNAAKTDWETAFVMWMRKAFPEFEADSSAPSPELVVVAPTHPDFLAVQKLRGKPVNVGDSGYATFARAEVLEARAHINAGAA